MAMIEYALLDRCLARVFDHGKTPFTKGKLIEQCSRDVRLDGREAKTGVYLKGSRGMGLKRQRSIFPSGPLGEIAFGSDGRLYVEFPALELLGALDGPSARRTALAKFYLERTDPPYPNSLSLALAIQLAQQMTESVAIAEDVVEAIWNQELPNWNAFLIALNLLEVEDEAKKRRWKRVDLAKWKDANLTYPVLKPTPSKPPKPVERPKPPGVVFRITERQASLLLLFERSDEDGKRHIEESARFAAAQRQTRGHSDGLSDRASAQPRHE